MNGDYVYKEYHNVCWNCKAPINSETNAQCNVCGWYICGSCGSCNKHDGLNGKDRGFCKDYFGRIINEITNSVFSKSGYDIFGFDKNGFDKYGCDKNGINKSGVHKNTVKKYLNKKIFYNSPYFGKGTITSCFNFNGTLYVSINFENKQKIEKLDIELCLSKGIVKLLD